ncbi:KH domain-containing, RNA-binding, signal transduction-associated protein 1-like [Octopus sinensis]|uniref:KH domain-containing, RNA-binding, signal transduction-associated protein 1-like n=1 Tax=Octopus sinensis TaxID=2607531 RepID=A0A6P7U4J3_9MOLL|nr:KH domain-containing, RNA-binding, signal transduction-associated protein 1-like [Octopus sinensis]
MESVRKGILKKYLDPKIAKKVAENISKALMMFAMFVSTTFLVFNSDNSPYFYHPLSALSGHVEKVSMRAYLKIYKSKYCIPSTLGATASDFNFVGRILGPRGMTAKQIEYNTGCKIMIRGRGSMRDKTKEEQNRGKPNWEHLNEELHVLITVEDILEKAEKKLKKATNEIKKLLLPSPEGQDELKKNQLIELAILNGTYRDESKNYLGVFLTYLFKDAPIPTIRQILQFIQSLRSLRCPQYLVYFDPYSLVSNNGPEESVQKSDANN